MRLQTQVEPEIQKRLLLSRVEAESLKERDILCPTCGFRIQRVFSDATGHLSVRARNALIGKNLIKLPIGVALNILSEIPLLAFKGIGLVFIVR